MSSNDTPRWPVGRYGHDTAQTVAAHIIADGIERANDTTTYELTASALADGTIHVTINGIAFRLSVAVYVPRHHTDPGAY